MHFEASNKKHNLRLTELQTEIGAKSVLESDWMLRLSGSI